MTLPKLIKMAPFSLCFVFVFLATGCSEKPGKAPANTGPQAQQKKPEKKIPVAVERVKVGEAISVYTTTATLEAEHRAQILARTTGVIRRLDHEEGDLVEKDQVLLQIENDDQILGVKRAKLALAEAEQDHKRHLDMQESGILSPQEFEDSENAVLKAKAELEIAELSLSYTTVRAPLTGRIVRRTVDMGAHVQAGAQLFEMMDVDPLLARIHIPANRLGHIKMGQTISLTLDSTGVELSGTISLISPIVDPETGTIKVTTEIQDYPENTRPGDFTEARVVTAKRPGAMLIPSIAVFEELGKHVVFVAAGDRAVRKIVEVGFINSGHTEITDGLESTDLVVIKGQRDLRENTLIEILEGPSNAPPEENHLDSSQAEATL